MIKSSPATHRFSVAAFLGSALVATAAVGQTRTFDGNLDADGGDGATWTDPLNWSGDNAPDTILEHASIDAGGAFDVTLGPPELTIGNLTVGADDRLTLDGGDLTMEGVAITAGTIDVKNAGFFYNREDWTNTGTVTLHDDFSIAGTDGMLTNTPTGVLRGSSSSLGFIATEGLFNHGTISPGHPAPGGHDGKYLVVAGELFLQPTSIVEIEIGGLGTTNVDFDQIHTATDLVLGGTLNVTLFNDFIPDPGLSYPILSGIMGDEYAVGAFLNAPHDERLMTTDGLGSFLVTYDVADNAVKLSDFQLIPEPTAAAALLAGLAAATLRRGRRSGSPA